MCLIMILTFFLSLQMIGHSALGFILWRQAQTIDLSDSKSMQVFYMFIFKVSDTTSICEYWIKF